MSLQFCLLHETPSQAVTPAQRRWNLVSVQVDIGSMDSLEAIARPCLYSSWYVPFVMELLQFVAKSSLRASLVPCPGLCRAPARRCSRFSSPDPFSRRTRLRRQGHTSLWTRRRSCPGCPFSSRRYFALGYQPCFGRCMGDVCPTRRNLANSRRP